MQAQAAPAELPAPLGAQALPADAAALPANDAEASRALNGGPVPAPDLASAPIGVPPARAPPPPPPGPPPLLPPADLDPAELAAAESLAAILAEVARTDIDGFFRAPVVEALVPGYHAVVRHPMCFLRMRHKVFARAYETWGGLVDDFERVCANATLFNARKSRVHRAALALQRSGRRTLAAREGEGRAAVVALHPGGAAGVAAAEAACAAAAAAAAAAAEADALARRAEREAARALPPAAAALSASLSFASAAADTAASAGDADGGDAAAALLMPSDADGGGSSFSDSGSDREEALRARAAGAAPAPLALPWATWMGRAADAIVVEGGDALPLAQPPTTDRAVEWRLRWLDLRMRDLRRLEAGYEGRLAAALEAEKRGEGEDAAADGAAALLVDGEAPSAPAAPAAPPAPILHARLPRDAVAEPPLAEHPFFAALLGAPRAPTAPPPPPLADDANLPAVVHAALEACERYVTHLRSVLAPPRPGSARARAGAAAGRARAGAPRSARPPRPRSEAERAERADRSRRSRRGGDQFGDVIIHAAGDGSIRVERPIVAEITTPGVRLLDAASLAARDETVAALRAHAASGRARLPPALAAALAAVDEAAGGAPWSDSEDTDDDAFLARHAKPEAEEKARFAGAPPPAAAAAATGSGATSLKRERDSAGGVRKDGRPVSAPRRRTTGDGADGSPSSGTPRPLSPAILETSSPRAGRVGKLARGAAGRGGAERRATRSRPA
jgi:hypothetical protein